MARSRRGRTEGSIYQRADGRWVACVSLGVSSGKRRRIVAYGATKAEAAAKLRELQLRTDASHLPESASITVEQWLERWLALVESSLVSVSHYRTHARRHIIPRIGSVRIQRLRPADVETLYARLLADGITASLVRKIGTTLGVALNHAVRSQLIPSNPARGVRRPRVERPRIAVLDSAQVAAFVAACAGERMGPLFLLMLDSGCRTAEALALTWLDLDFERGRISITKAMTNSGEPKTPKTERSNRTIDLTPGTIAALHEHRKRMLAGGRDVRRGLMFVGTGDEKLIPRELSRRHLHPILDAAGLPRIGTYSLRHTCATLLLAANVNPKIVSERLGHSSIAITLDTYSHVLPGMQSAAVDVLGRALGG